MKPSEKKEKKKRRSHGAVTVFLTLVLLPCMIFTCAFGDVSRVALSKSQAIAAADLALYSLMSHYDENLKEAYGLVASVDDIASSYSEAADYYTGMMSAAGLEGTSNDNFASFASSVRTGGSFTDFLQVDFTKAPTVTAAKNASLGTNPALIEDGIVEFMKYRGPVEIVSHIIDRFTALDLSGQMEDANEDQPIVDAKKEYAQAEGDMLSAMLYTYLALNQYEDYRENPAKQKNDKVPDMDKYQTYPKDLTQIWDTLPYVTELITKYYSFSYGLGTGESKIEDISSKFPQFSLPVLQGDEDKSVKDNNNGKTYYFSDIKAEEIDGVRTITWDNEIGMQRLSDMKNVDEQITNIQNAANAVVTACSGFSVPTFSDKDDVNPAVYCMKVQKSGILAQVNTIKNNASSLMEKYAHILLALECTLPNDQDWKQQLETAKGKIETVQSNYLSYTNKTTDFETILADYLNAAEKNHHSTVYDVQEGLYNFTRVGEKGTTTKYHDLGAVTVGTFFRDVRAEFEKLYEDYQHQIKQLDTILYGGSINYEGKTYTVVSMDTLIDLIKEYDRTRDAWGDEAYSHSTDYALQEQEEYEQAPQADDGGAKFAAALGDHGVEDAETLKQRLLNIRADMQSFIDALDNFTYGGQPVRELTHAKAVSAATQGGVVPTDVNNVSPSLKQNAQDAAGYHPQLVSPPTDDVYTAPQLTPGEGGNDPILTEDIPALYQYMKEALPLSEVSKATHNKDQYEEENKKNEERAGAIADESKSVNKNFVDDLGENLENASGGATFGVDTAVSGLVDVVVKLLNGNSDEFRDQIYVVEYAMDMFSWSSFNNEGAYGIAKDQGVTLDYDDFKEGKFKSYIDQWKGGQVHGEGDDSSSQSFKNMSLTNRPINSANNHANLAEIEYLLFGDGNIEKDLKSSYTALFTIREALNLISGFQNFYSASSGNTTATVIEGIAGTIMAATCGIIPIPLTKVILIGILATIESAHDLDRLKAGLPVALYKGVDSWYYKLPDGAESVSVLLGENGPSLPEPTDPNGLFYSDYMYLFLALAANDPDTYPDMLKRIGDLIEANMAKQGHAIVLDECQVYFQLTSSQEVKPLLLTLPIVDSMDGVDASSLRENTSWCEYNVSVIRGYS